MPISNFNTLQLRSLVKDISKFYGVPFTEVNPVTSKMLKEATPLAKKAHGIKAGVYTPTFEELKEYSESLRHSLQNILISLAILTSFLDSRDLLVVMLGALLSVKIWISICHS